MQSWKVEQDCVEVKDGNATVEMYPHRDDTFYFDAEDFVCDSRGYERVNLDFEVPLDALCALLEMRGYMLVKKENIEP